MKRSTKNIIMILIIIGLLITSYFVMKNIKVNNTNSNMGAPTEMNNGNGGPPGMPGDNSSDTNTPPSMPNESTSTEDSNSNSSTPPEKPDDDSNSSSDSSAPPEMSNSDSDSTGMGTPPDMNKNSSSSGMPTMSNETNNSTSIDTKYYIIFASLSFVIAIDIMYLLLSGFNKKSLKETFNEADKTIIYLLSVIVITSSLTLTDHVLTKNYFNKNNSNNTMNGSTSNSVSSATYKSSNEITEDKTIKSGTYESEEADSNALLVNGDVDVSASNITVTKSGDSDGGDNTSFYGTNSAITAKSVANLTLKNITVTTNATGANGVFSYGGSATTNNSKGDGTTINISDSKITTTKDNSGGIMTTGGGVMNASNLTIKTSGISSAAIRSDRGGGTVNVDGGTYETSGQGSPTIYSTANITVKNATLTSTASEGVVIEGNNTVTLENVTLTDTNNKLNGQSTTYKNIFLYQSMSGDAASGNSEFSAKDSTITTNKGDTLYVTNTTATINLENNKIINNDSEGNFLRAKSDSWGKSGSNGGDVTLVMKNQSATGDIVIDSVSTLDMTMKNNSYYEGTINSDKSAKSIKLTLDKSSKIKLTGDSYVTELEDADSSYSNIDFNGYKLYVNGKAIN